jgi:hypothetical protein
MTFFKKIQACRGTLVEHDWFRSVLDDLSELFRAIDPKSFSRHFLEEQEDQICKEQVCSTNNKLDLS